MKEMKLTITLDIPTKELIKLTGASRSAIYRAIGQNGTNVGHLWDNLGTTLNAKVLSVNTVQSDFGTNVGQTWDKRGTLKEKEQQKEEVSPTPPIEEKEKEKESLSPTLINQRFIRVTPQGTSTKGDLEEASDNSPIVVEGVKKKPTKKAPVKTMEQLVAETKRRQEDFYYLLAPYVATYGKEMIREFYDYWSETNKSQTKMRWETEKTWVLNLRLQRWANNNKSYRPHGTNQQQSEEDLARQRRAEGAARVMQAFLNAK